VVIAVFVAIVVAIGAGVAAAAEAMAREHSELARQPRSDYQPTLLSHVAYDGEVVEYPTTWACPWEAVAAHLAEIDLLPEAAGVPLIFDHDNGWENE